MKRKDWEQLKIKSKQELIEQTKKDKERLWNLQVDLRAGKSSNIKDIRELKKTIAKINTILNQK